MSMMNNAVPPTQPSEDTPTNITDVASEFDAMINSGSDVGVEEPEVADAGPVTEPEVETPADEAVEEEVVDEEVVEEEPPVEEAPADDPAALRRELDALKGQLAAFNAGFQQAGGKLPQGAEAPQQPRGEITIGEIVEPFTPEPPEEALASVAFLGIGSNGASIEQEYDAVINTPQGLNEYGNRIRRSTIRAMLQMMPKVLDGYMGKLVMRGSLQQEFYAKNKDLEEHAPVVEALAEQIRSAEPHLTKTQFLQKLNNTARMHLKKQRPTTKSGGTTRLQQGQGPQAHKPKPALAGGTGARRVAPKVDPDSIDSQVNAMRGAG